LLIPADGNAAAENEDAWKPMPLQSGIRRTAEELLKSPEPPSELRLIDFEQVTSKRIFEAAQRGDKLALQAFE